ncbi:MAG: hypothetical protein QOH90_165, partial [Actinomycetota bacterium]|nr:hypothetical protein [Actinomycetota bacterium]
MNSSKLVLVVVLLGLVVAGAGACSSSEVGGQETLSQADKALALQLETSLRNAASSEETFRASNGAYTADVNALRTEGL